jgi:DMSO reductase anchor subunit
MIAMIPLVILTLAGASFVGIAIVLATYELFGG